MRPLILEKVVNNSYVHAKACNEYECRLKKLRAAHHSECVFNRKPSIVPGLQFSFDDAGVLHGTFSCNGYQQGYDQMVHGGVIAAVIDASMAQCLMGHGIVGYTADLSIKYRKPVKIHTVSTLVTSIAEVKCNLLYTLNCIISQEEICVKANGKFFKVK